MKWLTLLLQIIKELLRLNSKRQAEEAREELEDEYKAIRDDPDAALRERGWLQPDDTRRTDGAPRDYDVSGPSGTLRGED